jgi:membrane associated rhomboid family serine protease
MDFGRMPGSKRSRKRAGGFGGFGGVRNQGGGSMWSIERGSLGLVIASIAMFAACAAWRPLAGWVALLPRETLRGLQLWRLVSAPFVSASIGNLLFAALGFWWLGSFLERAIGTSRFITLFLVASIAGNLVGAIVGLTVNHGAGVMVGPEVGLFAITASWWFVFGRTQAMFFGAMPVRIDVVSWIFCGLGLAMALVRHDWMIFFGDIAGAGAAWMVVRGGFPSFDVGTRWARLRLWWLRRRYKVLDGGKSSSREKKWMN